MKRRDFMTLMAGALSYSQMPVWARPIAKFLPVDEVDKNLDLDLARRIKEKFLWTQEKQILLGQMLGADLVEGHLDLSEYSSASLDALECLASLKETSVSTGFRKISPETAKALSAWDAFFISFSRVHNLCTEAATYLGCRKNNACLAFQNLMNLEVSCAERLVRNQAMMHLRFQTIPSRSLAKALATHRGSLLLRLPSNQISPSAAEALSFHCGYRLRVVMPEKPSETVLRHFASNSNKTITIGCSTDPREARPDLWFIALKGNYDRWLASEQT